MTYSYDALNLNDGTTYKLTRMTFDSPPRAVTAAALGTRPGGRISAIVDGMRSLSAGGFIRGATQSATEANRDTLLTTLGRRRKRLILSGQDNRFSIASLGAGGVRVQYISPTAYAWDAEFVLESPYAYAPTPSGDVRSPTLALLPNQTTQYGLRYSLTPGGNVATPLRVLVSNPASGNTPSLVQIANLYNGIERTRAITAAATLAAPDLLVIDPEREGIITASCTNIVGLWPLEDASGNALDFSGDARNLTVNGAPTFRQDGIIGGCCAFTTTATFFDRADAALGFTSDFSAGAWVNHDSLGAAAGIIGKRSASNAGWGVHKTSGDVFAFTVANGASTRTATGFTTAVAGQWYRVVVTFTQSSGTLALYVNGRLEAVTAGGAFTPTNAGNNFRVAAVHNTSGTAEAMVGRIDEPFALDTVLTAAQVATAYEYSLPMALRSATLALNGFYPELDPRIAATNTLLVRADHASSAPTPLVGISWRARYG